MKKIYRSIFIIFILILGLALAIFSYFLFCAPKKAENIKWGVNFSQTQARDLGLDWKQAYLSILDDLKAKELKIATQWDILEPERDKYSFSDLDWQIKEAEKRNAKVILAIGMKTPRWPECHIPLWAENLSDESRQDKVLSLLKEIISRYKNENSIWAWQVENEPFFDFGECPETNEDFVKQEVQLVKSMDSRPVIISESGENSLWLKAGKLADIVGVTLYKRVYSKEVNMYLTLPYPPMFYFSKAKLVKKLYGKDVMCVELQAEPWTPHLIFNDSLDEQKKTMDLNQFKKNIEFAKKTGFDSFYFWGAEWWYFMKDKQNQPEIWNEAKLLF